MMWLLIVAVLIIVGALIIKVGGYILILLGLIIGFNIIRALYLEYKKNPPS